MTAVQPEWLPGTGFVEFVFWGVALYAKPSSPQRAALGYPVGEGAAAVSAA